MGAAERKQAESDARKRGGGCAGLFDGFESAAPDFPRKPSTSRRRLIEHDTYFFGSVFHAEEKKQKRLRAARKAEMTAANAPKSKLVAAERASHAMDKAKFSGYRRLIEHDSSSTPTTDFQNPEVVPAHRQLAAGGNTQTGILLVSGMLMAFIGYRFRNLW